MSVLDLTARVLRARSLILAIALIAVLMISSGQEWLPSFPEFQNTLTVVAALFAVALVGGRALFWASPLFGHLHLRNDDNPLEEVSAAVARLRRWSPRLTKPQRHLDRALAVVLVGSSVWLAGTILFNWPMPLVSVAVLTVAVPLHLALVWWLSRRSWTSGVSRPRG